MSKLRDDKKHSDDVSDADWFDILAGKKDANPNSRSERRAAGLRAIYEERAKEADQPLLSEAGTTGQEAADGTRHWWQYAAAAAVGALSVGVAVNVERITGNQPDSAVEVVDKSGQVEQQVGTEALRIVVKTEEPSASANRLFIALIEEQIPSSFKYESRSVAVVTFDADLLPESLDVALSEIGVGRLDIQSETVQVRFVEP